LEGFAITTRNMTGSTALNTIVPYVISKVWSMGNSCEDNAASTVKKIRQKLKQGLSRWVMTPSATLIVRAAVSKSLQISQISIKTAVQLFQIQSANLVSNWIATLMQHARLGTPKTRRQRMSRLASSLLVMTALTTPLSTQNVATSA